MKIVFILNSLNISTPLGIMYLSAILKKEGHEIFLICYEKENVFKKIKELNPDILAYSVTTGIHKEYISINKEIKKHFQIYSIFGGPHTTFYPETIEEEGIDAICIGEGEEALIEFVNKMERREDISKVKNFWVKKNGKIIKNPVRCLSVLDNLPFPDREIIYKKDKFFLKLGMKRFMASRGCPFKCTYCFNRQYNKLYEDSGPIVRYRSVDNVLREIKEIKKKYPLHVIKFVDDTFNLNKEWLKEFSLKYKKEVDLPFICNIRADLVDMNVIRQLKHANCKVVYLGIETGNETVRKKVLERNMSNEQIFKACRLLKKYRIKIVSQNMLGLPGEKISGSFETILFNSKCRVNFPGFSIFQPYPGTILSNYSIKNGFFDGNFNNLSSSYLSTTPLNYSQDEKRQLENLLKFATIVSIYSFLAPIVRQLIRLPKNKIFDFIYGFFYGFSQWRLYSMVIKSPFEIIPISRKLFGFLFKT